MKKILSVLFIILISASAYSDTLEGGVAERKYLKQNRIVDKKTGSGIGGAEITIPKEN